LRSTSVAGVIGLEALIKLYQPRRAFGLPNPSAFCVKLEAYLRMAGLSYEPVYGEPGDAPKGKVPWIDDDGHILADSNFIIGYLKDTYGDRLDSRLSGKEQALGHAIKRMLEESLYFVSSYSKWVEDEGFATYSAELFAGMPEEQLRYVPEMVRKRAIEKLSVQGIGRHNRDEVYEIGLRDVASFEELLTDANFLFADQPTSFDASAFGVVGNLRDGPFPSPVRDALQKSPKISAYIDRIRNTYFGDILEAQVCHITM